MNVRKQITTFLLITLVGLGIWSVPPPPGIDQKAIHLVAIFVFTILGIIFKAMPMGGMAFLALVLLTMTKTLTFAEAFSGFNHHIVWLIVFAFFIARGFIKTGLGERIAYMLMRLLGSSALGMGYGMALTDLFLAPAIPSVTARIGGVLYPVVSSLSRGFESEPHNKPRRLGAFLIMVAFQGSLITSAMFLTSMAGNPLIANLAKEMGVTLSWGSWALAGLVPGLMCLACTPLVLYKIYPPELKEMPEAKAYAAQKLAELGSLRREEWIMIVTFVLLLILWIAGPALSLSATVTALLGLSILLLSRVLSWDDIVSEKGAWNILIWFSVLLMMASFLTTMGLTTWFSGWVAGKIPIQNWMPAFVLLSLVYFYSHYFFASNLSHIGAMFPPFLALMIALGTPPLLATLMLGFMSSLFGGLTHYACGPATIMYGSGYIPLKEWWRLGLIMSVVNLTIFFVIGGLWWKALGLF
jgi:DASS family divalent anion:Na+ symporter